MEAKLTEEKRLKRNEQQRVFQRRVRQEAIAHYGGKCECCGEDRVEFICIDRTTELSTKRRRQTDTWQACYWLRRHNYPKGVRILCYNCNCAIRFYGECPHKKQLEK